MTDLLFNRGSLSDLIGAYPRSMQQEVDGWDENKVLAASEADLVDYLVQRYTLDAPSLRPREDWDSNANEEQVDVSHDFRRGFGRGDRRIFVPGHRFTVRIPFEGDANLFDYRPSTFNFNPPRANIPKSKPVVTFTFTAPQDDVDANKIRQDIDREVANLNGYLSWVRSDCAAWNAKVQDTAVECLQARKRRLLQQADLLSSLGIPLKRHDDFSGSFSIPIARRTRPALRPPRTPREAFTPEPTIAEEDYDFILGIITSLAVSIERSPTTFARLSEEHIRDHLLVSLNGHFKGSATGETFSGLGKTDILIREQGADAFIAECKFWSGRASLYKAIDQLLGYATWRDTKTALILFSRNKDFSAVLQKIREHIPEHPNCKHEVKRAAGSGVIRYVFGQKNDESRELHLTVLAFSIPSPDGS